MSEYHNPVLLEESVSAIIGDTSGVYADATFGGGGHSALILSRLSRKGRLLAFDRDADALENAPADKRLTLIHNNFRFIHNFALLHEVEFDGILADLGVSSHQFDTEERGFSFRFDTALDMRMNADGGRTAADVVNTFDEKQLADIIYQYGEERFSRKIAKAIVEARNSKPFETTSELTNCIHKVITYKPGNIDTATRTFQALRIFVNDELGELERGLSGAEKILKDGGILSVVTFHSLEDRIVKNFLQNASAVNQHVNKYKQTEKTSFEPFKLAFKKPISASEKEIKENPRSRSAHLRSAIRQRKVK